MTVFIYPVLTSDTVNPNILPGVAKSIERYILVNRLDEIMKIVRTSYFVDRAGRVRIDESLNTVRPPVDLNEVIKPGEKAIAADKKSEESLKSLEKERQKQIKRDAQRRKKERESQKALDEKLKKEREKAAEKRDREAMERVIAAEKEARKEEEKRRREELKRFEDEDAAAEEKRKEALASTSDFINKTYINNQDTSQSDEVKQQSGTSWQKTKTTPGGNQGGAGGAGSKTLAIRTSKDADTITLKTQDDFNRANQIAKSAWDEYQSTIDRDLKFRQDRDRRAHEEYIARQREIMAGADAASKHVLAQQIKKREQQFQIDQANAQRAHDQKIKDDQKAYEEKQVLARQAYEKELDALKRQRDELKDREKAGPAKVDLGRIEGDTLSLEPTWVKIDTPDGPAIIGIKCVPFNVRTDKDGTLAELLLRDRHMSGLERKIQSISRKFHRWLFKLFYDKLRGLGMFSRGTLTQNPKTDIIYDRTKFRNGVYALVNMSELDNDFFVSAGGVKSLFKLGWSTIIVADDVNKRIFFVAPEFHGSYSMIPYPFLYSGINRDASQVYDNLEDVKKSSGPLFRRKGNIMKVLGEGLAANKIKEYKTSLSETPEIIAIRESFLNEDFSSIFKKMKGSEAKSVIQKIDSAAKKGDVETLKKVTGFVPKSVAQLEKVEKFCRNLMGSDFDKSYSFSKKVLKNSVPDDHPDTFINAIACFAAFTGYKQDDPMKNTKACLKKAVPIIRKSQKAETDWELVSVYIMAVVAMLVLAYPLAGLAKILVLLAGVTPVGAGVVVFFGIIATIIWSVRAGSGTKTPGKL